jgi:O-antigen/teichoic acid export membrane protein
MLSSVSNFALSAFVASTTSAVDFGSFSVAYAVYNLCVGVSGGLASIPLVVGFSAAAPEQFRPAARASLGTALVVGVSAGAACAAASLFTSGALTGPLLALGVSLPGLCLQDSWRYSFVASGHPKRAAANDAVWVLLQGAAIAVLVVTDGVSATSMVLAWGGAATVAAILGVAQAGYAPVPQRTREWLRQQRALSPRYAVEAVIHRSGIGLILAATGIVAGLTAVGALRGALLLVTGPLNLLFAGTTFVFVPEGVRLLLRSRSGFLTAMRRLSFAVTAIAAAWSVLALALPGSVGTRLLGDTWGAAEPLLPLLAIFAVSLGASMGATQGMLALRAARRSLFTQVAGLAVNLPAVIVGGALAGASGAALAIGLSAVFRSTVAWIQFGRAFREAASTPPPDDQGAEHGVSAI